MSKANWLCFLLVLVFAPVVWSGQVSPFLDDYLQEFSTSADVEVLVMFEQQADIQSLNQQLKDEKATLAERNRRVIEALQEVATNTQPSMVAYFDQLQSQGYVSEYKTMWIANMAIVKTTKAGVYAMADNNAIGDIALSYKVRGIQPTKISEDDESLIASVEAGLEAINAPAAWAAGFTGAGRVVANMDTGVDGNHPALADRFRGDVDGDDDVDESFFDPYTTGWTFPQDSDSHGTHTMGTICGRSEAGDTVGVAIEAQWIAAAAIDRGGGIEGTVADAIESFQWFVDPDDNSETQDNPDAVGNSWGISPIYHGVPPCDDTFWSVIDNLEAAGTAVIFSAGNEGPDVGSLRTPSDRATTRYNVFSVGAVDGGNANYPVASFSSRGPSYCTPDGEPTFKPEVVAPGVDVRSSVPGGGYSTMSGTSMASPHVTGCVGVIRGVNPDLDVDSIKEILMATAHDLGAEGPDNDYGVGIIDIYEACLIAMDGYGYIEGYVYDDDTEDGIANALVSIDGTTRTAIADDNGFYSIGLPADTSYSMTASYFGYVSSNVSDVAVVADETTDQDFYLEPADAGYLHGYVTDLDENPIESATLTIVDTPIGSATTDENGYYLFDEIPGGATYTVEVAAVGYGFASGMVDVPVGDTATLSFSLQGMESFEGSNGGYDGEGTWEWGVPSSGPGEAYDGNNVWATILDGNYVDDLDDGLITPQYEITDANAMLSFYHWYVIEEDYDGGQLQVSIDGGLNWDLLTPEGGYPVAEVVGLDDGPGFSGEPATWELVVVDLSAYEGETISIKFRFGTDGSQQRAGWYIDGVVLNGGIMRAPEASLSCPSMNIDVMQGDSHDVQMTLSNNGDAQLNYNVVVLTDLALSATDDTERSYTGQVFESKEGHIMDENGSIKVTGESPFNYDDVITSIGGPDAFGYTYIDSDEENGPHYEWKDITGIGSAITFNGGTNPNDDGYSNSISMGMNFEFYGVPVTDIQVSTNGWVSFNNYSTSYLTNTGIPGTSDPNNIIAVLWDDLNGYEGTCYYYYDETENQFIVSWTDWGFYIYGGDSRRYDMQVILDGDDNSILLQYGDISEGEYDSDISVGVENADGDVGLEYAYDNFTGSGGLAIKFSYPLFWLTVDPTVGYVAPEGSQVFDVNFNSAELEQGTYYGEIRINTNDPNNGMFSVPCTLNVGPVGIDDYSSAVPNAFTLNQNYPNPFNPTTEISFGLPTAGHVSLEVYDVMGRKVSIVVDEEMAAGTHSIIWDGNNLSGEKVTSGVYFYKLSQGDNTTTKKMIMLK